MGGESGRGDTRRSAVRAGLEAGADRLQRVRERQHLDPPRGAPREMGGELVEPGQWTPGPDGLPPGCPVKVLGRDGSVLYVLDFAGQLQAIKPSEFGQKMVQALFGDRQGFLEWAWPKRGKGKQGRPGPVTGFATEEVSKSFYAAAPEEVLWDPREKVRGRGAWSDKNGGVVLHAGDRIWVSGQAYEPRGLDGFVYPARPRIFSPWAKRLAAGDNPAAEILAILQTWNWRRKVDALLVLGWICSGLVGGALAQRPVIFLIGDKQVGKSTLQDLFKAVMGSWLLSTPETTAAGIYQQVGHDTLAVAVDELEAEADNAKQTAVLKLARLAYSGGTGYRGGSSGTGTQFQIRSSFVFSAINAPPLEPQDYSRMAVCRVDRLEAGTARAPVLKDADTVGPRLLRRLTDDWAGFMPLLEAARVALFAGGHDRRGQDTFGTLLACAYLALGDEAAEAAGFPTSDDFGRWGELLAAAALPEREAMQDNWRGCLTQLLTARSNVWRGGGRNTVGDIIRDKLFPKDGGDVEVADARSMLAQVGLGVSLIKTDAGERRWFLAVPVASQAVSELLRPSKWAGLGAVGVWTDALRQGPRELIEWRKDFSSREINGVRQRCTLVDLTRFRRLQDHEGKGCTFDEALAYASAVEGGK